MDWVILQRFTKENMLMNVMSSVAKYNNKKRILNCILRNSATSRLIIAEKLGLSISTVTKIINELLDKGLVIESHTDNTRVGRKTKFLSFNAMKNTMLAINIDMSNLLEMAICDLLGNTKASIEFPFHFVVDSLHSEQEILSAIIKKIKEFLNSQPKELTDKLACIALLVPGTVNDGNLVSTPLFNWKSVPICSLIQTAINKPVFVNTISRAAGIYEKMYVSEFAPNTIFLSIGNSIEMVQFINGEMILGGTNVAGGIGHMMLNPDGPKCYCGNKGCFEYYCGEINLVQRCNDMLLREDVCLILQKIAENKNEPLEIEDVFEAFSKGSLQIKDEFLRYAQYLGYALVTIFNVFDPEKVIIAGNTVSLDKFILEEALELVKNRILNRYLYNVRIELSPTPSRHYEKKICAAAFINLIDSYIKD
jgi:predicted NBD/HSP70 family sugar kinase/biotin operon repressor